MAETIVLNGIPYAAKDIDITMLGRIVRGITELNYSEDQEVEKVYVVGSKKPVARTLGKEDCKGDITLLVNEVAGIEIAADGSITSVGEFDLTVHFKALPVPLKQTLKAVRFTGKAMAVTAGNAGALGYKCGLDIMEILPLKSI